MRTSWKTRPRPKTVILSIKKSNQIKSLSLSLSLCLSLFLSLSAPPLSPYTPTPLSLTHILLNSSKEWKLQLTFPQCTRAGPEWPCPRHTGTGRSLHTAPAGRWMCAAGRGGNPWKMKDRGQGPGTAASEHHSWGSCWLLLSVDLWYTGCYWEWCAVWDRAVGVWVYPPYLSSLTFVA